jgi:anti-anti-sigma factor
VSDPELGTIGFEAHGRATVARIRGEVDLSNAERLHDELAAHVSESQWLVLDLTACDYLDSAGLGVIARIHERCRARGTRMRLVVPTGAVIVERALSITGMNQIFTIDRSIDDAVALAGT